MKLKKMDRERVHANDYCYEIILQRKDWLISRWPSVIPSTLTTLTLRVSRRVWRCRGRWAAERPEPSRATPPSGAATSPSTWRVESTSPYVSSKSTPSTWQVHWIKCSKNVHYPPFAIRQNPNHCGVNSSGGSRILQTDGRPTRRRGHDSLFFKRKKWKK